MKLVSSNDASFASRIIKEAIDAYRGGADVPSTIGTLTKLKAIGPATASLLLAVHDGRRVIFFSDEAFYWLCCNATKATIKYNTKEYDTLRSKAQKLMARLSVTATEVEKVAYVVMKQADYAPAATQATVNDSSPAETKPAATAGSSASTSTSTSSAAKRKPRSDGDVARGQSGTRRSKRVRV
jgi:NACalpha-BTF3-like transcription factor